MNKLSILAVAGVLALAGCGDDEEPADTGSAGTATEQAPPATDTGGAGESGVVEVAAKEIKFVPAQVTVEVGQTVKWTNEDPVPHNVVAEDESFKSEDFNQGESYEHTFDEAGTFEYVCTIHPGQEGTVTVE